MRISSLDLEPLEPALGDEEALRLRDAADSSGVVRRPEGLDIDAEAIGEEAAASEPEGTIYADGPSAEAISRARLPSNPDRSGPYVAGDVIAGKYRLKKLINTGGMGSVWLSYNLLLDVDVALKLIRPDIKAEAIVARFMAEARLAARIEHPAIVSIFDLGYTDENDPFIVMELLRGEDLRELLAREGTLGTARSVQLLLPIADALATAHGKGVVHRDLKPENVFIATNGEQVQPKLVDFGIAKPTAPTYRRLTRAGTVMGSPEYMSPEQAQGRDDVDHRVDVWAFCVALYECITGRPPFAGASYEALLHDIINKAITPITDLGVEDPQLWAILERGLAKDREARWQSMRDLGRALAMWLVARFVDEDASGHSLRATWLRETELDLRGSSPSIPDGSGSDAPRRITAPTLQIGAATPASGPIAIQSPRARSARKLQRWLPIAIAAGACLLLTWSAFGARVMGAERPGLQAGVGDARLTAARGFAALGSVGARSSAPLDVVEQQPSAVVVKRWAHAAPRDNILSGLPRPAPRRAELIQTPPRPPSIVQIRRDEGRRSSIPKSSRRKIAQTSPAESEFGF